MAGLPRYNHLFNGTAVAFNTTAYFQAYSTNTTTEADRKIKLRAGGVMSLLHVVVSANTIATSATTVRTRINAGNGSQSVSVGAGATGSFQDTVNTDTIAAGNDFDFQVVTPNTSGSITVTEANTLFAATSNSVSDFVARNGTSTGSSVTLFNVISGGAIGLTTEADSQVKFPTAGTLKHLYSEVITNAMPNTTTIRTRKNGADGTQALSIATITTGQFEDTSNTDTIAVNDLVNTSVTYGVNGGGNLISYGISAKVSFETTDSTGVTTQSLGVQTVNASVTTYLGLGGDGGPTTTEANAKALALASLTFSKLSCYVSSNTIAATSTITFRKNGANGNQAVSIGSLATGQISDATNSDSVVSTDTVNLQIVTGGVGTSLNLMSTYAMISAAAPAPATPVFIGSSYLQLLGVGV